MFPKETRENCLIYLHEKQEKVVKMNVHFSLQLELFPLTLTGLLRRQFGAGQIVPVHLAVSVNSVQLHKNTTDLKHISASIVWPFKSLTTVGHLE